MIGDIKRYNISPDASKKDILHMIGNYAPAAYEPFVLKAFEKGATPGEVLNVLIKGLTKNNANLDRLLGEDCNTQGFIDYTNAKDETTLTLDILKRIKRGKENKVQYKGVTVYRNGEEKLHVEVDQNYEFPSIVEDENVKPNELHTIIDVDD